MLSLNSIILPYQLNMCVCVCKRESEREGDRDREREKERQKEGEIGYVLSLLALLCCLRMLGFGTIIPLN
jgi:hypothetical protein